MIDVWALGFGAAMQPHVLLGILIGVVAGIIVGLIPGFTIVMGVVLVLPFTFAMDALQGIATMIGVAVGGSSGGLIAACLMGIPGTPSSMATTFDGYPMAQKGEPGRALGLGTIASFFGGAFGFLVLATATAPLAEFGLSFGPWEFFSLIAFALTIIASLSGTSLTKGLISGLMGMFMATVGLDPMLGIERYTFNWSELAPGFAFLTVLIGLFAWSQLMKDVERREAPDFDARARTPNVNIPYRRVFSDLWNSKVAILVASVVGAGVGIIPAAGGSVANILAYDQVRRASKHKSQFGKGFREGIIASEAGNNATFAGALVPLLALGIPGDAVAAVMIGALLIHGLTPGPLLMVMQPALAYGAISAFLIGTVMMVLIQTQGMRIFARLTLVPYHILVPGILVLTATGSFVLNNRIFDIWVLFFFGLIGYFMSKNGFELAPFVLGFILEPIAEINIKRALQTDPNLMLFITRPISALFLFFAFLSVVYYFWGRQQAQKPHPPDQAMVEEGRGTTP
jgi:putative tricarboxylic transport membrane protein